MEKQEIHLSLYASFLLALLAPDLWRGQEIHFILYIKFLFAPDLCTGQEIHFSL